MPNQITVKMFLIGTLMLAGASQAATLFSPPLSANSINGDNAGQCEVTNLASRTRDIVVQGFNSEGLVIVDQTFNVAPMVTRGFSLTEMNAIDGPVIFCKFSFRGRAGSVRATINVLDGGGDGIIAVLEAH